MEFYFKKQMRLTKKKWSIVCPSVLLWFIRFNFSALPKECFSFSRFRDTGSICILLSVTVHWTLQTQQQEARLNWYLDRQLKWIIFLMLEGSALRTVRERQLTFFLHCTQLHIHVRDLLILAWIRAHLQRGTFFCVLLCLIELLFILRWAFY